MSTTTHVEMDNGLYQLSTLKTQFDSALQDFQKYYVYYHKNPEVSEFQHFYSNAQTQLQQLTNQVGMVERNAQQQLQELAQTMQQQEHQLTMEKKKASKFEYQLSQLENAKNGASMLVDDTETLCQQQYYRNVELLVGLGMAISFIIARLKA